MVYWLVFNRILSMYAPRGDWSTETESCNFWSKRSTSKPPWLDESHKFILERKRERERERERERVGDFSFNTFYTKLLKQHHLNSNNRSWILKLFVIMEAQNVLVIVWMILVLFASSTLVSFIIRSIHNKAPINITLVDLIYCDSFCWMLLLNLMYTSGVVACHSSSR